MEEIVLELINKTLESFDFPFCIIVNIATYLAIKLYTDYSDGSIFEYHGYKPYIDSRAEVFLKKMNHKENILKEYLNFNLDEKTRDKFIKKYDFAFQKTILTKGSVAPCASGRCSFQNVFPSFG